MLLSNGLEKAGRWIFLKGNVMVLIKSFYIVAMLTSVLRVGLHRKGGIEKPVAVELNGQQVGVADLSYSKGKPNLLDYVELPVNPDWIKAENLLKISTEEKGITMTAARIMTVKQLE